MESPNEKVRMLRYAPHRLYEKKYKRYGQIQSNQQQTLTWLQFENEFRNRFVQSYQISVISIKFYIVQGYTNDGTQEIYVNITSDNWFNVTNGDTIYYHIQSTFESYNTHSISNVSSIQSTLSTHNHITNNNNMNSNINNNMNTNNNNNTLISSDNTISMRITSIPDGTTTRTTQVSQLASIPQQFNIDNNVITPTQSQSSDQNNCEVTIANCNISNIKCSSMCIFCVLLLLVLLLIVCFVCMYFLGFLILEKAFFFALQQSEHAVKFKSMSRANFEKLNGTDNFAYNKYAPYFEKYKNLKGGKKMAAIVPEPTCASCLSKPDKLPKSFTRVRANKNEIVTKPNYPFIYTHFSTGVNKTIFYKIMYVVFVIRSLAFVL